MNIFGIGTDIVSVERVKKSIKNKNFLKRLFNEREKLQSAMAFQKVLTVMPSVLQRKRLFQKL